ncbi:GNAT family N-acetyltransferase [Litoreibacter roseus]|uniref:Acetyltransferase n=1 Tax=Litoreibacter roseus TaxID=2601869 RepID=A0A6N6JDF0_9RHOB|nr:N-acetyltransferase [Litoreibacter roseus]GFE64154.1 acetyltransferase [Litoreibacter roseus]
MQIRPARDADRAAIWAILEPVIRAGETYALPRNMAEEDALSYWCGSKDHVFVAEDTNRILGTYFLTRNHMGGGSHVCNCGYVTDPQARGRGIARHMCEHSLSEATDLGFRAMQFNLVVATNEGAVRLWYRLGFETVGTLPKAFAHPNQGDVDAFVMYKSLT